MIELGTQLQAWVSISVEFQGKLKGVNEIIRNLK